ncbi:uncharacterized protein LOC115887930 [Sitophilus oryzae]|uniref:Uncharacterized protein LOC115887930 n=1 Tax=Sitophilus oryzae TaxID=7048 RepID=A0A6J2YH35_SITOR|nr:uncharacterized protein LOC115887930 [Sitophilus oryzae]
MMQLGGVVFVVLGLLSPAFSDVDFIDCGSNQIEIESVEIPGCTVTPCRFYRNRNYDIYITPNSVNPTVMSIDLKVEACIRGANFAVDATFVHPCITDCPLQTKLDRPEIPINVSISRFFIPGLTTFRINATFIGNDQPNFCVLFYVDIY